MVNLFYFLSNADDLHWKIEHFFSISQYCDVEKKQTISRLLPKKNNYSKPY